MPELSGLYQVNETLNDARGNFELTPEGLALAKEVHKRVGGNKKLLETSRNLLILAGSLPDYQLAVVEGAAALSPELKGFVGKDGKLDRDATAEYIEGRSGELEKTSGTVGGMQDEIAAGAREYVSVIDGLYRKFEEKSSAALGKAKGALAKLEKGSDAYKALSEKIERAAADSKKYLDGLKELQQEIGKGFQEEAKQFAELASEISGTAKQALKEKYGLAETTTYAEVLSMKQKFDGLTHLTGNMLKEAQGKVKSAAYKVTEKAQEIYGKVSSAPASIYTLPA
ncbi:MAG: hypothetical protein V1820_00900 [archaeon]